jgi:small subunit ribosomal protein S21
MNKKTTPPTLSTIPPETDFTYFSPLEVVVRGNFDRALKIFKSLVQGEKVISQYKERQSYEKPSVKKRRKSAEARRRVYEAEMKARKIASGEYEKERLKKQLKREKKKLERESNKTITEE